MEPLRSDQQPPFQDITDTEHPYRPKTLSTISSIPLLTLSSRSVPLASPPGATTYRFHPLRTALNILGPILVTIFYILILRYYLWEPEQNGIIPARPVDAKGVFFAWVILSIFTLEWAKSGLAGFEAAALMNPKYSPSHGRRLRKRPVMVQGTNQSTFDIQPSNNMAELASAR